MATNAQHVRLLEDISKVARTDAKRFVDEFHQEYDSADMDWAVTAWDVSSEALFGKNEELKTRFWRFYQGELVVFTRALVTGLIRR